MRRIILCCALLGAVALAIVACKSVADRKDTAKGESDRSDSSAPATSLTDFHTPSAGGSYETIPQDRAKEEMDALTAEGKPFVLLDVRRADEYAEGHIEGAMLLPNEEIGTERPNLLPDLTTPIYVYCRSGRRSLEAAKKLSSMGYTVYDFGGIIDWQYRTVSE